MSNARTDSIRRIARAAFEAWKRGDAPITEIFAPQLTWRIEGRSVAARQVSPRGGTPARGTVHFPARRRQCFRTLLGA